METAQKYTPRDLVVLAVERYGGQAGAARALGCSEAAITRWLKGNRSPDFESRWKLCSALGISRDEVEV